MLVRRLGRLPDDLIGRARVTHQRIHALLAHLREFFTGDVPTDVYTSPSVLVPANVEIAPAKIVRSTLVAPAIGTNNENSEVVKISSSGVLERVVVVALDCKPKLSKSIDYLSDVVRTRNSRFYQGSA
jgi:hypothetical protein